MIEHINWYPGHMKKTRELIAENLKMVDIVIEVIDARIPVSSRNPIIDELVKSKRRLIILNKSDLSDPKANEAWAETFRKTRQFGPDHELYDRNRCGSALQAAQPSAGRKKRRTASRKIPAHDDRRCAECRQVLSHQPHDRQKSAKTGDRPGVTKGKQWLGLENGMQLLDTPGILWPKFEDPQVGLNLAFCGSIKDEILDTASLALELIKVLQRDYPQLLRERYKLDELDEDALVNMEAIAAKRGFILSGKRVDYERCARTVLDEFRGGKIGNITLEKVQA